MVQTDNPELLSKKVHPFFSNATENEQSLSTPNLEQVLQDTVAARSIAEGDEEHSRTKRRKTDTSVSQDGPQQKKRDRPRKSVGPSLDGPFVNHLANPNLDVSTLAAPAADVRHITFPTPPLSDTSGIPEVLAPSTFGQVPATPEGTPPTVKKVLKFNPKTGTLGSPPKSKLKTATSRMVSIKYGRDEQTRKKIGEQITQILQGNLRIPVTPTKQRAPRTLGKKKGTMSTPSATSTSTHPFFGGKAKQVTAVLSEALDSNIKSPARRNTISMSTPRSPQKPRNPFVSIKAAPAFGSKWSGTKIPGAMHPLWPAQGMAHVRGAGIPICAAQSDGVDQRQAKKSKGQIISINSGESIVDGVLERINLTLVRETLPRDSNNFLPAPPELRLPTRHFESGRELQKRIRPQLRSQFIPAPHGCVSSNPGDVSEQLGPKTHPAISRFYKSLKTQLSAYDRSTCECLSWTQKYSPVTAAEVLQPGKESQLLYQWLEALKVQSVDSGGGDKGKAKSDGPPKKKRKKQKLDGFIIDSDEENNEMGELSDHEDDWAPSGMGMLKRTVVRSSSLAAKTGKDQKRLANAVIISGPHGCGKTAAVYAVAKEMGYEIFEINSSSRRNGKDLLDKVGDMTRNHLVQHHRADTAAPETDVDQTAEDVKNGKQATMASFFKPKPMAAPKKLETAPETEPDKEKQEKSTKTSTPKSQKQSLILLEEVDVLYEEDKQFWTTLMGMIAQSKRPFIMTCNDENLVPIQSLNLHGIFRFTPPPPKLAVDLCLLIAANEGHALRRNAVEALYQSRGHDLRATITELNYWCQIGVGDRRGGSDWFYLRWPKGTDLDDHGDVVRVISRDTYSKGMGWIGRDLIASTSDSLEAEEEVIHQAWNSWQMDMGQWQESLDMASWADCISQQLQGQQQRLATMEAYDNFCTAMSDADISTGFSFASMMQEAIDPTLPELATRAKDDYAIGRVLLEAEATALPASPSTAISTTIKCLARRALHTFSRHQIATADTLALKEVGEETASELLHSHFQSTPWRMTRMDLAHAFDPIAIAPKAIPTTHLDMSVFDRTLKMIVLDVAPWVRGIVACDNKLMQDRLRLSNLLSEGGTKKRMRNTRAAYSALEGGERQTTRKERYFGDCLNTNLVMRTAGEGWLEVLGMNKKNEDSGDDGESSSAGGESS